MLPWTIIPGMTGSLEIVKREIHKGEVSKLEEPDDSQEPGGPIPWAPDGFRFLGDVAFMLRSLIVFHGPQVKTCEEGPSAHLGDRWPRQTPGS